MVAFWASWVRIPSPAPLHLIIKFPVNIRIVKKFGWLTLLVIIFYLSGCASVTPPPVTRIPPPPPEVEKKPEAVEAPKGPEGNVYIVKRGDTVYRIAKAYGVSTQAIITTNHISDVKSLQPGQKIIIPGGKKTSAYVSPADIGKPVGSFIWPVKGNIISYYGDEKNGLRSTGIDIRAESGLDVVAVRGGIVVTVTDAAEGSGGKVVVIQHQPGLDSWYGHIREILVNKGNKVKQGQVIARIDNQQPLHFKIFVSDKPVDPLQYLPK